MKFAELTPEQAYEFQKDLLLTLIRIEDVSLEGKMGDYGSRGGIDFAPFG